MHPVIHPVEQNTSLACATISLNINPLAGMSDKQFSQPMSYTIRSGSLRKATTLKRLCKNGSSYFFLADQAPLMPVAAHHVFFLFFFPALIRVSSDRQRVRHSVEIGHMTERVPFLLF